MSRFGFALLSTLILLGTDRARAQSTPSGVGESSSVAVSSDEATSAASPDQPPPPATASAPSPTQTLQSPPAVPLAAPPASPADPYSPPPSAAGVQPIAPGDFNADSPDVKLAHEAGTHCLLGGLCFGPVVTLGVLDVFGIGAQARSDHFGVGIDYQFFSFSANGIPTHLSLLTVEARTYPFGGAFFLSGGLAWQHANFRGHVTYPGDSQIPAIDTVVSGRVNVPVLKLGIGFLGRSGLILGTDLAFGIQLGRTKVSFSSDLPQIEQVVAVENKVRKRADTFVSGLPFLLQLNLIRLGFLF